MAHLPVGARASEGEQRYYWLHFLAVLACTAILVGTAGCSHRLESGSVFEQFVHDTPQSKRPADQKDIKTEYPTPDTWGPRVAEYRGDDPPRSASATVSKAKNENDGYRVSFNDAELAEVVRAVLLDTLKIGYVLDPNVKGKVTLASPNPLTRSELLLLLESVLDINRAVMISQGNRYKIVPAATVRAGAPVKFNYAAERKQLGPGYGISVLPLKHVSADEMIRLLASFVTQPGALRTEANRNLLLIRGTTSQRINLVNIASSFDVDWLRGQSAGIYRLLYATPDEMIAELTKVFGTDQNQSGGSVIRFEPVKRLNAVLVLTRQRKLLTKAATWIKRLDKTSPLADSLYVYRVEHADATQLAELLNKMFQGRSGTARSSGPDILPGQETGTISSDPSAATPSSNITTGSVTGSRTQSPGEPFDATTGLADGSSTANRNVAVNVVADERQNRLLIKASLRDYKKIVNILARLDRPAAQVLIKATLAEVQLNKNLRYGVQAFLQETDNAPNGVLGFSKWHVAYDPALAARPQFHRRIAILTEGHTRCAVEQDQRPPGFFTQPRSRQQRNRSVASR